MEWKSTVDEGGLELCKIEAAKAKKVYPNLIGWIPKLPLIGAIIIFQSETDFALGKSSLDYALNAIREGRREQCFVVFLRRANDGKIIFVHAAPAEEVKTLIINNNIRLQEGKWGPYWWLRIDVLFPAADVPF